MERVLTTHVGSLPRPPALLAALDANDPGFAGLLPDAVREVVRRQVEAGLDVVNDGEYGKPGFIDYATGRLSGLEIELAEAGDGNAWATTREGIAFPRYYGRHPSPPGPRAVCVGPIDYVGQAELCRDIDNLKAAIAGDDRVAFMPSISPVEIAMLYANEHYPSDDEYLLAVADALREEYRAIVDAGLILQVDDPSLVTYYNQSPSLTVDECRRWAHHQVEAINHALRGIPEDRVRFHTCYSINIGPRVHDMDLQDMVDVMLEVNAGAYSFEAGNARHEHEWRVWENVRLPDEKVLIPGVITNSSVMVEHPQVVADRIVRFAGVVGRERVIAGADCGFSSSAHSDEFEEAIVWAKLAALAEGARIASSALW
jgi:5-methyltetrahydropteroyltriglutamate--homocysteine methyltransferase